MKTYSRLLLVIALTIAAPSIFASISCSKPKLSKPVKNNSVYHFKAVVTCKLDGESINFSTIKDAYRAEILDKGSQFVVHSQQDYDNKKGMTGYSFDVTQTYSTDHGRLAVRENIALMDDKAANFYLELRSKSIVGKDEATYNKSIINEVKAQHFPTYDEVIVTKEIDVEQPWYAPQEMFFNKVETELVASIAKSAMLQAKKVRGDKVDALRK